MNTIVGIQVDVRENASAVAPRIVDQLAHIGDAGEEAGEKIQKAFDTTGMQSQFDRFADKMDKVFGKERDTRRVSVWIEIESKGGGSLADVSLGDYDHGEQHFDGRWTLHIALDGKPVTSGEFQVKCR